MIIFETERTLVRSLLPEDGDHYFSIHGDPEIMRYIRKAKSREETDQLLIEHINYNRLIFPLGRFMTEQKSTGAFMGTFVLFPINDTADIQIGYTFGKTFWGQGYATELIQEGIKYFFKHSKDDALFAIVEEGNLASEKALLKNGFSLQQKLVEGNTVLLRLVHPR